MTFAQRVLGVLKLDAIVFEEIEANRGVTTQALLVVVLASAAAGLGAGVGGEGLVGLIRETLAALIGWVMWAVVTYVIGTKLMPEPQTRTSVGELLRVIGFSYAPNFFAFFAFVPLLGYAVRTVVAFWLLATTVIAVRQALDYRSTPRAIVVVLIGWVFFVILQAVL